MSNKASERIGEKRIMSCGIEAEIIGYRNTSDIDVKFSDESIVAHKKYSSFVTGHIAHPSQTPTCKKNQRIGEKRVMACGQEAEIIAYRSSEDIDVRFADGTTVKNRDYWTFTQGKIKNPNIQYKHPVKKERLGAINYNKKGLRMVVTRYEGINDMNITFDDGTTIKTTWDKFINGVASNPNDNRRKKDRTGERKHMSNGQEAIIVRYGGWNDMDIKFLETGTIVHATYKSFKAGTVKDPNYNKTAKKHIGEMSLDIEGNPVKIINYRSAIDIDVKFLDGRIATSVRYNSFKNHKLHPDGTRIERSRKAKLGTLHVLADGTVVQVVDVINWDDVRVIDKSGIVRSMTWQQLTNNNLPRALRQSYDEKRFGSRVGEQVVNTHGDTLTLIGWHSYTDIDVRVEETGDIITGAKYNRFKAGQYHRKNWIVKRREKYIGMQAIQSNGETATIVAYRGPYDVDVAFPDDTLRKGVRMGNFKKGSIAKPLITIGKEYRSISGLLAIVEDIDDVDGMGSVVFEDGTRGVFKASLISSGKFRHPLLSAHTPKEKRIFCSFTIYSQSFMLQDGRVFYNALSPDGIRGIWTPQQMMGPSKERNRKEQ